MILTPIAETDAARRGAHRGSLARVRRPRCRRSTRRGTTRSSPRCRTCRTCWRSRSSPNSRRATMRRSTSITRRAAFATSRASPPVPPKCGATSRWPIATRCWPRSTATAVELAQARALARRRRRRGPRGDVRARERGAARVGGPAHEARGRGPGLGAWPARYPAQLTLAPAAHARGTVALPGSKSISNRALLLAALAQGTTTLVDLLEADDTKVMLEALRALGIAWRDRRRAGATRSKARAAPFPVKRADLHLGLVRAVDAHARRRARVLRRPLPRRRRAAHARAADRRPRRAVARAGRRHRLRDGGGIPAAAHRSRADRRGAGDRWRCAATCRASSSPACCRRCRWSARR